MLNKKSLYLYTLIILYQIVSCQPQEIDLSELTVTEIHTSYKSGEYTSEELVQAYINRIGEYDEETINSIILINPEALTTAKALDDEFKNSGTLRPLHGIPLIVKDNYNTKGIQTTAGSVALEGFVPDRNSWQVQKLIDAGAIVLAKSNMAEWAFSPMHSESSLGGTTRNPYDLSKVPAGSSGGTGAAIAANFGTLGLGTDTGNSIRGPSSHNSLVGFRSTLGLTSREGIVPLYLRNDVGGPMCRTVEDATRILELIAGYDPNDPITRHSEGRSLNNYSQFLDKNGLQGARIGVLRALTESIDPEIDQLLSEALKDMESMGATIIDPLIIPDFDSLRSGQWCTEFAKDVASYLTTYVDSGRVQSVQDIIAFGGYSEFVKGRLERTASSPGRRNQKEYPCQDVYRDPLRIAFRKGIEDEMDRLDLDAIVYPSWNFPPADIERFSEDYKGDNSQIISPHTGQPAFTIPMGYNSGGLPAGLQFLGRMYSEPVLIRLTYGYEQGTLHRKTPQLPKPN